MVRDTLAYFLHTLILAANIKFFIHFSIIRNRISCSHDLIQTYMHIAL